MPNVVRKRTFTKATKLPAKGEVLGYGRVACRVTKRLI
jgi:hypothetical protein